MIKFRKKEFSVDLIARHIRPGVNSNVVRQGSNLVNIAVDKAGNIIRTVKRELPNYDPTSVDGASRIVKLVASRPFTTIGLSLPFIPFSTPAGIGIDEAIQRSTGGGLTRFGETMGNSILNSAPYNNYLGTAGVTYIFPNKK